MSHWIESHGIECILAYYMFASFVGSMPPLPDSASYWAHWAYGFLHVASANLRTAAQLFNVKLTNGDKPQ